MAVSRVNGGKGGRPALASAFSATGCRLLRSAGFSESVGVLITYTYRWTSLRRRHSSNDVAWLGPADSESLFNGLPLRNRNAEKNLRGAALKRNLLPRCEEARSRSDWSSAPSLASHCR